jgi:hypothetical protein
MNRTCRVFALLLACSALFAQTEWKAGVAKTAITPTEPIWLAGFAARTKPSEGVRQDIYVRALALQDQTGRAFAIVTLDLVSIDRQTADEIAAQCRDRYGIARDRLVMNVSHTHSGPVAGLQPLPFHDLTSEDKQIVARYTKELMRKTVDTVGAAIADLEPANLWFEQGLAGIAVNRRRVGQRSRPGPVDHDVPTLAVRSASGALRAIIVGYACHATALNDYLISIVLTGYAIV